MPNNIYEVLWMKVILDDLKIKYEDPIRLFCDNPAISIAHNPVQHEKTKHIEIGKCIHEETPYSEIPWTY